MKLTRLTKFVSCLAFSGAAMGQVPLNTVPSRALGHARLLLSTTQPNLLEGRELNRPQGAVVDTSGPFPILYVADTLNNRVLGWNLTAALDNGAKADVVLGQRDPFSTAVWGPGTSYTSGLSFPTGVAADALGNLYVVDAGNNRIVRYPKPFEQPDQVKLADLVIGQPSFASRGSNQGGLSERTLSLTTTAGPFRSSLAFDPQGNLWVSDAGNNRVLRYPSSALGEGASNGPAATLVLGQPNFRTNAALPNNVTPANRTNRLGMRSPSGIALDQAGRLFVCDALNRVLVFTPPFTDGMLVARLMGITVTAPGQPPQPPINETSLGAVAGTIILPAEGVFTAGNVIFVLDTPANRIVRYKPFDQWPPESATQLSPSADAVIGQDVLQQTDTRPNRNLAEPNNSSLLTPVAAWFAPSLGETFVVDSDNHRVLVYGDISTGPPLSAGAPYAARRVMGQVGFEFRSANLIEGREFQFASAGGSSAGVAVDALSSPPRLYVADTLNNRILCFADARKVRHGDKADLVIGQPDFFRAGFNFPSGNSGIRNNSGLAAPVGVAVDRDGNLWVADTGNSRILRFPSPFSNPGQVPQQADLVIGQSSFTVRITDATARTMSAPYGLAFSAEGYLLVSDAVHNRVLMFVSPFTSGMAASRVFGQADFNSTQVGATDNRFNGVRHLAMDTDDRLYVCDAGNSRVLIFSRAPLAGPDPRAAYILSRNLRNPAAVVISPVTGEIWVANTAGNQSFRYPNFDRLVAAGDMNDLAITSLAPLAMALDGFGNLFVAENVNRVAIHFPTLTAVNGANYLSRLTPGMVTTLQSRQLNYSFTEQTLTFDQLPNPLPITRELGDLEVRLDGAPVPLYFISPQQINFQMPNWAPTSGTVEIEVQQVSTGRIISAAQVRMDTASPGLFTLGSTGTGQVAAINAADGTVNGSGAGQLGVQRGQAISIFATGPGHIPDAPPDGMPAEGVIDTPNRPVVILNAIRMDDSDILYSGLAPGLVGVWQINLRVPDRVPPGSAHLLVVLMNDIPSNNPQAPNQIRTTIAVR